MGISACASTLRVGKQRSKLLIQSRLQNFRNRRVAPDLTVRTVRTQAVGQLEFVLLS
jgi:hypothetical protein